MKLLVDTHAFDTPEAREAGIRKRLGEGNIHEYAYISGEVDEALYKVYGQQVDVLTEPSRLHLWAPLLIPDLDLVQWFLEHTGFARAKARGLAQTGRPLKYAAELRVAQAFSQQLQQGRPNDIEWVTTSVPAAPGVEVRKGRDYRIATAADLETLIQTSRHGPIAIDFETQGRYPLNLEPDGFSYSTEFGVAYYVPLNHSRVPNVPRDLFHKALQWITDGPWVAHNAKFEMHVLRNLGIDPAYDPHDTSIMAYHLGHELSLKTLSLNLLRERMDSYSDTTSKTPFRDLGPNQITSYAGADADMCNRLFYTLKPELSSGQWNAYEIDRKLVRVLCNMERRGVAVDEDFLRAWENELIERSLQIEARLRSIANINWSSRNQVADVLFNRLGLDPIKFNSLSYATDEPTLQLLKGQHPVIDLLMAERETQKKLGTYAIGMQYQASIWPDHRLRAPWNGTKVKTGRLSSGGKILGEKAINLQNLPPEGKMAVIAGPGNVLVGADYAQVELRIMAEVSQDEVLISDFLSGISPHIRTMLAIFGTDDKKGHPTQYTLSKNTNFGVIFGIAEAKLQEQAREGGVILPLEECARWLQVHRATYPRTWEYIDSTKRFLLDYGYTQTLSGHYAYYPEVYSDDIGKRGAAEREAVNHTIQGEAGYRAKQAMNLWVSHGYDNQAPMLINEHDAFVVECDSDLGPEVQRQLEAVMKEAFEGFRVPIEAEGGIGHTWKSVK